MNKDHLNHNLQNDIAVMMGLVSLVRKMEISDSVKNIMKKLQTKLKKTSNTLNDLVNPKEEVDIASIFKELDSDLNINVNGNRFILNVNKRKGEMFVENIAKNAKESGASNLKISCGKKKMIIRDDGNGFSEKDLQKINSNIQFTTKVSGSGIGSQYIRDFCKKNNLNITYSNNFTKGCQIIIDSS